MTDEQKKALNLICEVACMSHSVANERAQKDLLFHLRAAQAIIFQQIHLDANPMQNTYGGILRIPD